jgi:hypothetical protein
MAWLPDTTQAYFDALKNGLLSLLPSQRVKNQTFLLDIYAAVQSEKTITVYDLKHLNVIMTLSDQVTFPPVIDVKTYAQAEAFLIQACARFSYKDIRYALEWAFLLLARHSQIVIDLPNVRKWLGIWRIVQNTPALEQGFLSDFIRWMESKKFGPRSISDIVREALKFKAWMNDNGLVSLNEVGNVELQRYLLNRAYGHANTSKQRVLGHVKTLLHYYKETINGGFILPDYTVRNSQMIGVNASANSKEIERLWEALEAGHFSAMAGLMLVLILGYGLPLRALPLLRLTEQTGCLLWTERLPCRRGIGIREIQLALNTPWLARLWKCCQRERKTSSRYPYLFVSGYSKRRNCPVSFDYCQNAIQTATQSILGYPIPVNHLERGALKQLARRYPLTHFMRLTANLSKSRLVRMLYWLAATSE